MYQLTSNVQLPGSKQFGSQIIIYYCTPKNDFSLAKGFQKYMSKDDRKHGVIDQVKYRKRSSKIKWTDREYHVQDNADVAHKDVEIYCDTNQFPKLPFFGSHTKPNRARRVGKQYNLRFDPNIGHGICAIFRITCSCVSCTSILDKLWISGIQSTKQARYQPVINCTYWPFLGPYHNCNIIQITPKLIPSKAFDEINQVALDGISENMASLVQSGMYGSINTDDNTSNGLYLIQFISEACTLKINTTIDRQVISAGELVFKAQYICSMQENTNWYWKQ